MNRSFCNSRPLSDLPPGIFPGNLHISPLYAGVASVLLIVLALGGCASAPVKTEAGPVERSEYSPIKVFALDFASAWETTLLGLRQKGVPIGMEDREKGIIRTEFQEGEELQHLGKVYSSRYKYNIFLFREGEKKSVLNLRCTLEGREKGGKVFFDGSYLFPREIVSLENRMYRAIESYLLPLQASRPPDPLLEPGIKRGSAGLASGKQVPPPDSGSLTQAAVPPPSPAAESARASSPPAAEKSPRPSSKAPAASRPASKPPSGQAAALTAQSSGLWATRNEANLREGPSLKSKVILRLKKGTKLEKIGHSGTWIRVRLWGKTIGWVSQELLQEIR